jgi:putative heme iron utilization protein
MNGVNTCSIQFFDRAGHAAFKAFLNFGGALPAERAAAFEKIRATFQASRGRPSEPEA